MMANDDIFEQLSRLDADPIGPDPDEQPSKGVDADDLATASSLGMVGGSTLMSIANKGKPNPGKGALGGALSGASAGMALGPLGALGGAVIGGIGGFASTARNRQDYEQKHERDHRQMLRDKAVEGSAAYYAEDGGVIPIAVEDKSPIQTEIEEYLMFPDLGIHKSLATKKHEDMDDEVTDVVPAGTFVFSDDEDEVISKYDFSDEEDIMGYSPAVYKEGEKRKPLKQFRFTDIFGDKEEMLPSELAAKVKRKFPVSQAENDIFGEATSKENKAARAPYLKKIIDKAGGKPPTGRVKEDGGYVSKKIKKLMDEGYDHDQAVAIAINMAKDKGEYRKGGVVRKYRHGNPVEPLPDRPFPRLRRSPYANAKEMSLYNRGQETPFGIIPTLEQVGGPANYSGLGRPAQSLPSLSLSTFDLDEGGLPNVDVNQPEDSTTSRQENDSEDEFDPYFNRLMDTINQAQQESTEQFDQAEQDYEDTFSRIRASNLGGALSGVLGPLSQSTRNVFPRKSTSMIDDMFEPVPQYIRDRQMDRNDRYLTQNIDAALRSGVRPQDISSVLAPTTQSVIDARSRAATKYNLDDAQQRRAEAQARKQVQDYNRQQAAREEQASLEQQNRINSLLFGNLNQSLMNRASTAANQQAVDSQLNRDRIYNKYSLLQGRLRALDSRNRMRSLLDYYESQDGTYTPGRAADLDMFTNFEDTGIDESHLDPWSPPMFPAFDYRPDDAALYSDRETRIG